MAALYGTVRLQVIEGIKLVSVAVFHAGDGRQAARFDPQLFVQLPVNTVQLELSCRPCSVYGQKPCWRGDYACLREIKPEQVIAKIEGIIN